MFAFMVQFGQSGGSSKSYIFIVLVRELTAAVIFWVKSYNVKGQPAVFSVPEINIIPLGVSHHRPD